MFSDCSERFFSKSKTSRDLCCFSISISEDFEASLSSDKLAVLSFGLWASGNSTDFRTWSSRLISSWEGRS